VRLHIEMRLSTLHHIYSFTYTLCIVIFLHILNALSSSKIALSLLLWPSRPRRDAIEPLASPTCGDAGQLHERLWNSINQSINRRLLAWLK